MVHEPPFNGPVVGRPTIRDFLAPLALNESPAQYSDRSTRNDVPSPFGAAQRNRIRVPRETKKLQVVRVGRCSHRSTWNEEVRLSDIEMALTPRIILGDVPALIHRFTWNIVVASAAHKSVAGTHMPIR
jgi:hypothetical protein